MREGREGRGEEWGGKGEGRSGEGRVGVQHVSESNNILVNSAHPSSW